jgi:hypothetical protein
MRKITVAGIIAAFALVFWVEYLLWGECRADHSWLYCVRVLGK